MENTLILDIEPIGKPRMTQRDKWHSRPATTKFWNFKRNIQIQAKKQKFTLSDCIEIYCFIQKPKSERKKGIFAHRKKPDIDNIVKAILDSLKDYDQTIYIITVVKLYADFNKIVIVNKKEDNILKIINHAKDTAN